MTIQDISNEVSRKYHADIERELVTLLEIIEGRVPSDEEVARYGKREIDRSGDSTFKWRNLPIFSVSAPNFQGWTITRYV